VTGALASPTDAFPVFVQQDRDGHKQTRKKGEERACPADVEVAVHGSREEREHGTEYGSDKAISGQDARRVFRISIGEVSQNRVLDLLVNAEIESKG
jgi:hypothetical protein